MSNGQYYLRRSWLAGNYHCSNGMCSLQSLLSMSVQVFSAPPQPIFTKRKKRKNPDKFKIEEKTKFTALLYTDTVRFLLFIIAHVVQSLMRKTKKSNNKQHNFLDKQPKADSSLILPIVYSHMGTVHPTTLNIKRRTSTLQLHAYDVQLLFLL